MKFRAHIPASCTVLAVILTLPLFMRAQQTRPAVPTRTIAYDTARETVLQGTVLEYTENSSVPPIGAHVVVQTTSGTVDVHLGPASYLHSNQFSLAPGQPARFVGTFSKQAKESVFLARVAQSGGRVITLRSTRGFLLARSALRAMPKELRAQVQQAGPR